jgi:hypothetical protein
MSAFFEITVGAVLLMIGVRVLWMPELVVMGYQVEMSAFGKPLGIFLCLVGLLWVWVGVKKKID